MQVFGPGQRVRPGRGRVLEVKTQATNIVILTLPCPRRESWDDVSKDGYYTWQTTKMETAVHQDDSWGRFQLDDANSEGRQAFFQRRE